MLAYVVDAKADDHNRFYLSGYMGLNIFPAQTFDESLVGTSGKIGFEKGYNFAGAIGMKLTRHLRVEGEFNYINSNLDALQLDGVGSFTFDGGIKTKLAMLNLYYDIDLGWRLMPYVGAGLGYAWHEGTLNDISGLQLDLNKESSGYMYQVGGGFRYPLTEGISMLSSYRYLDGADLDFGDDVINHGAHEFRMGLSWDLPFE